jgi:hypothetical protein
MGGRKVCFIDADGQVGTCIRDDENCLKCDLATMQTHYNWQKSEHEQKSKKSSDYYTDMYEQLIVIEKQMCGIRGISAVICNFGYRNLHEHLNKKTDTVDAIIRNLEQMLIEQMRKQREETGYDTQRLELALKRMG